MTDAPNRRTLSRFTPEGVHVVIMRVYYEDTDAGGVVYYANYLKFAERARTETIRDLGIDHRSLLETEGVVFAVRRCEVDYLVPARLDDEIEVHTTIRKMGAASLDLLQTVRRRDSDGPKELARLTVRLAVLDGAGRPARLPKRISAALQPFTRQAAAGLAIGDQPARNAAAGFRPCLALSAVATADVHATTKKRA